MDGRINVAKAPEIMVSRRRLILSEKANPESIPGPDPPLENTPHKAGVVGDEAMRALVAFLDVAAQSGSAAGGDVTESFPLLALGQNSERRAIGRWMPMQFQG